MRRLAFVLRPGWIALALVVIAFTYLCFMVLAPWQLGKNSRTSRENHQIEYSLTTPPVPVKTLLPRREHHEAQVGEGDDHQRQRYPAWSQQKRQAPPQTRHRVCPFCASRSSTQSCRPGNAASMTAKTSSKSSGSP